MPAPSETSNSSVLAPANLSRSCGSRTNARMTRTPVICSRSTRLISSSRSCICRNSGRIRKMISASMMASSGTAISSSDESGTFWFSARMIPPTHMIGADSSRVNVMIASIWTCWTSLVVLVISDAAPRWFTSRSENISTRRNTPCLTSRPRAIAAWAPK